MHSCLSRVPIFQGLSSQDQARIHQFIRPRQIKKGEFIQLAGHYTPELLVLNRGRAKVYRTSPNGSEQIIRLLKPGEYLGETAVFTSSAAQYSAVATEDSVFCTLSKDRLHQALRDYPDLGVKILADMSRRLETSETQVEALGQKPVQERLIETLKQYSGDKSTFRLPISKKDLASQIGVRPETLSRQLKRLQDDQTIAVSGQTITWLQDL